VLSASHVPNTANENAFAWNDGKQLPLSVVIEFQEIGRVFPVGTIKYDGHYMYRILKNRYAVECWFLISCSQVTRKRSPSIGNSSWEVPRHRSVRFDMAGAFEDRRKSLIASQFCV
jgi:hypothetical protein